MDMTTDKTTDLMKTPRIDLPRGNLLLIGAGAIGVALTPGWVLFLRSTYKWNIRVCLTRSAEQLVSPLALAVLSGNQVFHPSAAESNSGTVAHRELADWADLILVAPATGNCLAKRAAGIADDLALTVLAFTDAPVVMVPSVSEPVLRKPATKRYLALLEEDGVHVMPTAKGFSPHLNGSAGGGMPNILSVLAFLATIEFTGAAPAVSP